MKISYRWLIRYLKPKPTADEVANALPKVGFEIDDVEERRIARMENVVVGEVLSREQHPNADRLGVCSVNTGDPEPRQIVCGATNYKVGDRVPVALPGAVLPGDFKIKVSKLRGVESQGMMCSAREIGLGEEHEGLLILSGDPEIGQPINEVLADEDDTIFDIEINPNRPDALCHIGIARELAAWFDTTLLYPATDVAPGSPFRHKSEPLLKSVTVENSTFCPHYRAYSVRGVKVGDSPDWLKKALQAIGLRPVNNVVDVTNFVLHELGSPLHAFDARKIAGEELIIRPAEEGEKITTLDGKERTLSQGIGVIADREKPLVVAGIMGSLDAEVDSSTTDLVLEAAYFNPSDIRRTSRALGLSSDSSYRFERGVDTKGAEYAALRALDLIVEVAGGEVTGPPQVEGEPPLVENEIAVFAEWIEGRLGFTIDREPIKRRMEKLEMGVQASEHGNREEWRVSIPSFRVDLERPIDLVEEVLRVHGTENIPEGPVVAPALDFEDDPLAQYVRAATDYLVAQDFAECQHYTLRPREELAKWSSLSNADNLALANPLSADQSHLRPTLLTSLLDALRLNRSRFNQPRRLFETGRVFREKDGAVYELLSVAFVEVVEPLPEAWQDLRKPDFYTAKGHVERLLELAGIEAGTLDFSSLTARNFWQSKHSAQAGDYADGFEARCGLINLSLLKEWDLDGMVLAGSMMFLPDFLRRERPRSRYMGFSGFPPTTRDLALLVSSETLAETVRRDLAKIAEETVAGQFALEAVRVFDLYEGQGLPEGHKSLALSLVFRASDRTLTDDEVNAVFAKMQEAISERTSYQIRK